MNQSVKIILPPKNFTNAQFAEFMFGNAVNGSIFPQIKAALRYYLFNRPFRLLAEGEVLNPKYNELDFNVNTPYDLLPQSLQLKLFDIARDLIQSDEERKIYGAAEPNFIKSLVHSDYLSQGNLLNYIANNKTKFVIPKHIKYISNDCLNKNSNLTELVLSDKLSYNGASNESYFTTPDKMMSYMPNLKKISFLGRPHNIEKVPAIGLGDNKYILRINNLQGLNISFCLDKKCPRGFIQIDKAGTNTAFRYDLLNDELSKSNSIALYNTKVSLFDDKDLVVSSNQIYISDVQYFYKVLKDFNNPNSITFKSLGADDWAKYHYIFNSLGVQSGLYDKKICQTYSLGLKKRYNRLLSPNIIFSFLQDYLMLKAQNKYFFGKEYDYENLEELAFLIKNFKNNNSSDKNIKDFLNNCR